jgi:hypothetical protein
MPNLASNAAFSAAFVVSASCRAASAAWSFANCANLSVVYFKCPNPPTIDNEAFSNGPIKNGYYYDTYVDSWSDTTIENVILKSIPKPTTSTSTSTSASVLYQEDIKKTNYIIYINYILIVLIIILTIVPFASRIKAILL